MSRAEELKNELAATVFYGEEIGHKMENPDISDKERADLSAELEAVEKKAQDVQREYQKQLKDDERELRIKNIGREYEVQKPEDEPQAEYKNAFQKLFDTAEFKAVRETPSDLRSNKGWTAQVEFKAPVDPTTDNPSDLVPQVRPGLVQPFVYPQRVGSLFTQATMNGSTISWLDVPTADGQAEYTAYGAQKGGPADLTIDVHSTKASKITTTYTVPDEALDDLDALESTIRQILAVGPGGVQVLAESEYINGSGTGTPLQLAGIDSLSPDDVSGSGSNFVADVIFAALDIENDTGFAATAVVMNPADYFYFITIENSGDGRPLFAPYGNVYAEPQGAALPPIVRSKAVTPGTAYVGAWDRSLLYTRQGVTVRATNEGIGLADKNLTMFVAELRQALIHPYGASVYRTVSISS